MADPTLIIDAEPNWRDLLEIGYSFATAIQGTPRFLEQRRPLLPAPQRSISCRYGLETENAQRLLNILLSGSSQLCCIPIYSEPLFAGTIIQGASSITVETDLTYLWNVKNCDYLVLLDYVTGVSEMLKVSSVVGQVVTLVAVIVGSWVAAQTVMYPAMAGIIKEVKRLDLSGRVSSFGVEFAEAAVGEESGKSWVGLDEQVCPGPSSVCSAECSDSFDGSGTGISADFWDGDPQEWIRSAGVASLTLNYPPPAWQQQGNVNTKFEFNGPFDVQIDWSLENIKAGFSEGGWFNIFPSYGYSYIGLWWGDWQDSSQWLSGDGVQYWAYGDSLADYQIVATLDRSGKLRITRDESGNVRGYFWNASLGRWEWDGDSDGILLESGMTDPTTITIEAMVATNTDAASTIKMDNFCTSIGCDNITWY